MDVKKHVTDEQQQAVIQIPSFLQNHQGEVDGVMAETTRELMEAAQQGKIDRENNVKHLRDLTAQAEAMDKQEQEATVKGISSDVMFAELLNRQMYYEKKMNKICEVMGDA